jgi:hypothetical protein
MWGRRRIKIGAWAPPVEIRGGVPLVEIRVRGWRRLKSKPGVIVRPSVVVRPPSRTQRRFRPPTPAQLPRHMREGRVLPPSSLLTSQVVPEANSGDGEKRADVARVWVTPCRLRGCGSLVCHIKFDSSCWNLIKGSFALSISHVFYNLTGRRGSSNMISGLWGIEFEPRPRIFRCA